MRALVTGGAGFIGSYLAEKLVKENFFVTIFDNLFRGKIENINKILEDKNNNFFNIDLADTNNIDLMAEIILREQPSLIFHYAAINGTQYFYDIPSKVLEVNTLATRNLMTAIKLAKEKNPSYNTKIIYASSSEVYGEPFTLPTKEDDITYVNVSELRDSYAASKLIGEFFVKLMCIDAKVDYLILRLFNVYGPRMIGTKYGQVIPEFITRLREGEYPLKIYGNGEHKRSFCYIEDNINMTVMTALSSTKNEILNIGNDEEVSIFELGNFLMNKMNLKPEFIFLEERSGDHKRRCPNNAKLKKILGEIQFISLNEGLEKMINATKEKR